MQALKTLGWRLGLTWCLGAFSGVFFSMAQAAPVCFTEHSRLQTPMLVELEVALDPSEPGLLTLPELNASTEIYGSVCLTWSPDRRFVALTERIGSNLIETSVIDTQHVVAGALVKEQAFVQAFPLDVQQHLANADHTYSEVVAWQSSGLQLHLFGHSPAYDYQLRCQLSAGSWQCQKV